MSGWGNSTTPRGAADGRRQTGHRLLFNRETETEVWATARLLKRLNKMNPAYVRYVRILTECFIHELGIEDAERAAGKDQAH